MFLLPAFWKLYFYPNPFSLLDHVISLLLRPSISFREEPSSTVQAPILLVSFVTTSTAIGQASFPLWDPSKESNPSCSQNALQSQSSLGEPCSPIWGVQLAQVCSTEKWTTPNESRTPLDLVLNSDPFSGVLIALHSKGMSCKTLSISIL